MKEKEKDFTRNLLLKMFDGLISDVGTVVKDFGGHLNETTGGAIESVANLRDIRVKRGIKVSDKTIDSKLKVATCLKQGIDIIGESNSVYEIACKGSKRLCFFHHSTDKVCRVNDDLKVARLFEDEGKDVLFF